MTERAAFLAADRKLSAEELLPKRLTAPQAAALLRAAAPLLQELTPAAGDTTPEAADHSLEERLRELAVAQGVKFGDLMMTIRLAATGSKVSPPLFGSLRLLGGERVRGRLAQALRTLDEAGG